VHCKLPVFSKKAYKHRYNGIEETVEVQIRRSGIFVFCRNNLVFAVDLDLIIEQFYAQKTKYPYDD